MKSHLTAVLAAIACSVLAILALQITGLGDTLERSALGLRFRLRPVPVTPPPLTVVVLRGQRGGSNNHTAREELASLLTVLSDSPAETRPRAVVVDLLLSVDRSTYPNQIEPIERIIDAERKLGTVVQAFDLALRPEDGRDNARRLDALDAHSIRETSGGPVLPTAFGIRTAHASFANALYQGAAGAGFTNLSGRGSRESVSLNTVPPLIRLQPGPGGGEARIYPALGLAGAAVALCGSRPLNECVRTEGSSLRIGASSAIPLDPDTGELWVNHRKRFAFTEDAPLPSSMVPEVVLFRSDLSSHFTLPNGTGLPQARLAPSLLVVDGHEPSSRVSPLGASYPLGTFHAQIMSNLLEHDFLIPPARSTTLGLCAALVMLALTWRVSGRGRGLARAIPELLLVLAWSFIALAAFRVTDIWLPVAPPVGALIGSLAGWGLVRPWQVRREAAGAIRLAESRDRIMEALRTRTAELEEALLQHQDRLRAMEEAGANGGADDGADAPAAPDDGLTSEALADLDAMLQETQSLLERHHGAQRPNRWEPRAVPANSLSTRLDMARSEVTALREELDQIEARLEDHRPALAARRERYHTRIHGYQRLIDGLQGALRAAIQEVARLDGARSGRSELDPADSGERVDPSGCPHLELGGCMTADPTMMRILTDVAEKIGRSDAAVLIQGETGTGKELIARAIHDSSPRRLRRYVAVNCGGFNAGLLESELFGHVRGSFTGALRDRPGLFVDADGGTLFLDELGEMPLEMQKRLLRVLETGEVQPVGGDSASIHRVKVRVIGATHVDLVKAIGEGRFRQDLFYRLNVLSIALPPLRARRGDVALLAPRFLELECASIGRPLTLTPEATRSLAEDHTWPGNVRELRDFMRRLAAMADGPVIDAGEVRRALSQGTPFRPAREEELLLEAKDRAHLELQRLHRFSATACEADPRYGAGRQTASRHLRVLIARSLWGSGWRVQDAIRLLAGPHVDLEPVVSEKLEVFLANLEERMAKESEAALADSLRVHYRGDFQHIARVLDALREGWLTRPEYQPG